MTLSLIYAPRVRGQGKSLYERQSKRVRANSVNGLTCGLQIQGSRFLQLAR